MNCFTTFSAGDSCYQCNICVNFVFCTECYQDQEDIHANVRRHRRAHAMTHFVMGPLMGGPNPADRRVGSVMDSGAGSHFTNVRSLFTGETS